MRRLQSLLAVLSLTLVACAGDAEPEATPPESAREPVALTSSELAAYKKEMSQIFSQKNTAAARHSASGTVAEIEGHGSVALVKVDGEGGLVTTCAGSQEEALQFLTSTDGLEVK